MHEECFKRRKAREELLPVYLQADRAYAEAEAHLVVLIEAAAKSGMASDQRAANEFRHDAYLDATKGALIAAHRLIGALGYGA
jgi:hypothetical protein